MKLRFFKTSFGGIVLFMAMSCNSKALPDEKFTIKAEFVAIFNSVSQKDTLRFVDSSGQNKTFFISRIDSTINNRKGWFINERPHKALIMGLTQIGSDSSQFYGNNELYVGKDPISQTNGITIKLNNFYYSDTLLPLIHSDTINISGEKITNYYLFESSRNAKNPNDILLLYINVPRGIAGFTTFSGKTWKNKNY